MSGGHYYTGGPAGYVPAHGGPPDSLGGKVQQHYFLAKQTVMKKLNRKEDQHVVAADVDLDSKLELFCAIQKSCSNLLRTIEAYQDKICDLSGDEEHMARFLGQQGKADKTRAGKMMQRVGKTQMQAAQQRMALRVPLVRLYQEVETFRYRAVADTLSTIKKMEETRTDYRAALLWMKDVSSELDPDAYRQLEKFRTVQAQVRKTKLSFERLKVDCIQKIDLLAASRCNMFSNVLANYQNTLLTFWEKTSKQMQEICKEFKGYQHYEFNMLKELTEPSKRLAETTSEANEDAAEEEEEVVEVEGLQEDAVKESRLIELSMEEELEPGLPDDGLSLLQQDGEIEKTIVQARLDNQQMKKGRMKQAEQLPDDLFDLGSEKTMAKSRKYKEESRRGDDVTQDLLGEDVMGAENDDFFNTILNANESNAGSNEPNAADSFTKEWDSLFGDEPRSDVQQTKSDQTAGGLVTPSQLMHFAATDPATFSADQQLLGMQQQQPLAATMAASSANQNKEASTKSTEQQDKNTKGKKKDGKDMSAWFGLFAHLDPLSNPDAVGKTDADERNC